MEDKITISKKMLQELISNYWCASGAASDIYDRCDGYEKEGLSEQIEEVNELDKWVNKTFGKLDKQEYI